MTAASPPPPVRALRVGDMLPRCRLLVLYASQTGTAEDLALQLADTFERLHFAVRVLPADALARLSSLRTYALVVFVASTTGQGEMPDNACAFWRSLCRKKLPHNFLHGVQFALFACGDSAYVKFCWAGRKLVRRLLQLGGEQIVARGEGNQSAEERVEGAYLHWVAILRKEVLRRWPLPAGVEEIPADTLLPPKWTLQFDGSGVVVPPELSEGVGVMQQIHAARPGSILGKVKRNERVTAEDHWQDVRHLSFSLPESVEWEPGDTLSLSPKNFPEDVELFLSLQGWKSIADRPLRIYAPAQSDDIPPCPVPHPVQPLTLRTLLTHHLDITAIPRRSFFALAAGLTTNETHAERLREFADPQWVDELWDYTTRPRRSLLEVLQEFGSVRIGLDRLLEVVPRMRERLFSIAGSVRGTTFPGEKNADESAVREEGREVDLLVAIVRYKTIIKKIRQGVCTRWLASLQSGDTINVLFQKGSLGMTTESLSRPVVMVSPGTGVAPMRALLWDRVSKNATGGHLLFFGCRGHDKDNFFAEEWRALEQKGLARVFTAFSRDQKQKRYVQTLLREEAELVWEALGEKGGIVFVCGSSGRMPQAVREALIEIFESQGAWSRAAAEAYLMQMEKDGRYRQETWG